MNLKKAFFEAVALRDAAKNTGRTYWACLVKFYQFIRKPASQWTGPDVERWLIELHRLDFAPKSRKQALCALVFCFKHVLKRDLGTLNLPPMPKERQTLKTIPTREELGRIFAGLRGQVKLMAGLMYGSGLRIGECCKLRVQDIDIEARTVRIWNGKGDKSRLTVLAEAVTPSLRRHIEWRRSLHEMDAANGCGLVELPRRLAMKYKSAHRELRWQWLFPSTVIRGQYRWHTTDESVAKQMRAAVKAAGIIKRITPHTLRHAFATHAMQSGNDPRTVQDLLGHENLTTTMIYLHADAARGFSPMDVAPPRIAVNGRNNLMMLA
ncbi:integron integrase [Prosthecobacter sp.]|uniref:integron integrase n=1 Tax=Prosthecobacter sp. TaxID=1965333 RepID=UPI003783D818